MDKQVLTPSELDLLLAGQYDFDERPDQRFESALLALISSAGRGSFAQLFTEIQFSRGQVIFREGEPGDDLYIIRSGHAVAFMGDIECPEILGFNGAGEVIGEMALLENRPRSASVVAVNDVVLLRLHLADFRQLVNAHPSFGLSIMESLSYRLRKSDKARYADSISGKRLASQVTELQSEKQQLLELQRLRQETSDLIVHDLRNPLHSLSVAIKMLEMLLPDEVLEDNQEIMDIAASAVDRMQRLVDSLLDVARMEAGETSLLLTEVDLLDLVEELIRKVPPYYKNDFLFETLLPTRLPIVRADRDMIERVLNNLVDNAIKYTQTGGQISIATDEQDGFICVSVTDTGPGIPAEDRERIFERFTQVNTLKASEKRKRRGFGLGLADCRLAIEAHGGCIWVEPGEGGIGSRFLFTLPLTAM